MNNDKGLIFCHYAQVSLDWVLIETRTHTHRHRYGINQNLKVELTLHGNFQGTVLSSHFLFPNCSSGAEREGSRVGCNPVFKGFLPNPPLWLEQKWGPQGRADAHLAATAMPCTNQQQQICCLSKYCPALVTSWP